MQVRSALKNDLAKVVLLEQKLLNGWSEGSVFQEFERNTGILLVAYDDGVDFLLGWCSGLLVGEEVELLRIAVAPEKRRCGVASVLLNGFEQECLQRKVTSCFLEVASGNVAARRLYEKFAYVQIGRRKAYYRDPPDDALVMSKIHTS